MGTFERRAAFVMLLLVAIFTKRGHGDSYHKVTPSNGNPGIYYEYLGEARLIRTQWRVITTLDCKPLSEPLSWKEQQLQTAMRTCLDTIGHHCHIYIPMESFKRQIATLKSLQDDLLQFFTPPTLQPLDHENLPYTIRKRGAPFEFVGWTSKKLFGTMDAGDKEQIMQEIDKVYDTQRNATLLAANQTHIVRSSLETLHQQMAKNEDKIQTIYHELIKLLEGTRGLMTSHNYTDAILTVGNWVQEFEESLDYSITAYKTLINAVEITAQGRLRPLLFTHEQIKQILDSIRHTKMKHTLPWDESTITAERLFALSKTHVTVHEGRLVIILIFPLNGIENFKVFRLHSLPTPRAFHSTAAGYISIRPKQPYLFVTRDYLNYFLSDEAYVKSCQQHEDVRLCPTTHPIREDVDKACCEYTMLTKPSQEALKTCNIALHNSETSFWKRLETTEEWIYSCNENTTLNIVCDGLRRAKVQLKGSGLLAIDGECTGNTDTMTLPGTTKWQISETFVYEFDYPFNFSLFLSHENHSTDMQGLPILDEEKQEQIQTWANSEASISLEEIENQFRQIAQQKRQRQLHTTYVIAGSIGNATLIIVLIIIYYYARRRRTSRNVSIPLHTTQPIEKSNVSSPMEATNIGTQSLPTIFIS